MQSRDRFKKQKRDRFQRFNIVFPILLAGWVPSILTLVVSYTILTNTLESKILRDRQTFIQLIAHLVGDDLSRTRDIIEYYQTLPDVAKLLTGPNAQFAAQLWLGSTFYSHPRIDGMFIAAPDGALTVGGNRPKQPTGPLSRPCILVSRTNARRPISSAQCGRRMEPLPAILEYRY